jgi:hypothetical protein
MGLPLMAAKDLIYTAKCFVPKSLNVIPGTGKKESIKDAFIRKIHESMEMRDTDPVFKERGPGVFRIVVALETLVKMFPDDIDVNNIVDKLLEATRRLYLVASDPVSLNVNRCRLSVLTHIQLGEHIATAISTDIKYFVASSLGSPDPLPCICLLRVGMAVA